MEKYFQAVGRRKTARAIVKIFPQTKGEFLINGKPLEKYFPIFSLQKVARQSLEITGFLEKFKVLVNVTGGGPNSQAEAIRHGIARALVLYDPNLKPLLKEVGFLKRDPRMKERKKFGLKRARRAPQWQKR